MNVWLFGVILTLVSSLLGGTIARAQPVELEGGEADAVMDAFLQGDVTPLRGADGLERWRYDEVFCTVGFAAIVCRLERAGEERYIQGAPAETIARAIVGPFSTLYNIYVDDFACTRGPGVPSVCRYVRT